MGGARPSTVRAVLATKQSHRRTSDAQDVSRLDPVSAPNDNLLRPKRIVAPPTYVEPPLIGKLATPKEDPGWKPSPNLKRQSEKLQVRALSPSCTPSMRGSGPSKPSSDLGNSQPVFTSRNLKRKHSRDTDATISFTKRQAFNVNNEVSGNPDADGDGSGLSHAQAANLSKTGVLLCDLLPAIENSTTIHDESAQVEDLDHRIVECEHGLEVVQQQHSTLKATFASFGQEIDKLKFQREEMQQTITRTKICEVRIDIDKICKDVETSKNRLYDEELAIRILDTSCKSLASSLEALKQQAMDDKNNSEQKFAAMNARLSVLEHAAQQPAGETIEAQLETLRCHIDKVSSCTNGTCKGLRKDLNSQTMRIDTVDERVIEINQNLDNRLEGFVRTETLDQMMGRRLENFAYAETVIKLRAEIRRELEGCVKMHTVDKMKVDIACLDTSVKDLNANLETMTRVGKSISKLVNDVVSIRPPNEEAGHIIKNLRADTTCLQADFEDLRKSNTSMEMKVLNDVSNLQSLSETNVKDFVQSVFQEKFGAFTFQIQQLNVTAATIRKECITMCDALKQDTQRQLETTVGKVLEQKMSALIPGFKSEIAGVNKQQINIEVEKVKKHLEKQHDAMAASKMTADSRPINQRIGQGFQPAQVITQASGQGFYDANQGGPLPSVSAIANNQEPRRTSFAAGVTPASPTQGISTLQVVTQQFFLEKKQAEIEQIQQHLRCLIQGYQSMQEQHHLQQAQRSQQLQSQQRQDQSQQRQSVPIQDQSQQSQRRQQTHHHQQFQHHHHKLSPSRCVPPISTSISTSPAQAQAQAQPRPQNPNTPTQLRTSAP